MADPFKEFEDKVRALRAEFDRELAAVRSAADLQALRDHFLGRKSGEVKILLGRVSEIQLTEERRERGRVLNELRQDIEARLAAKRNELGARQREQRVAGDRIDVTLPGRPPSLGRRHPLTATREELEAIFVSMGYEVYEGPEVDDDYHCFEALNMPPDHPARDMQDTFYLRGRGALLRTHTSTGQIRYMLANPHPPLVRIICPGKCFRRDEPDLTHSPMFHQIEGLVVGPGISLGDLKGTVEAFLHALFGPQYPVRFRSSFFPYTEPSVEVDLQCISCGGSGCRVCKGTGWLEIMGSGMVHPAVFEAVNARLGKVVYDPEEVTGFAFGLGIERVAILRHGVDDIRLFFDNDLRFLEQFHG